MWSEGTIGINAFSGSPIVCRYEVKHFEEGSEFGIDGGRISKLEIRIKGEVTCRDDRGWDIEPEDEATVQAYSILMHEYN